MRQRVSKLTIGSKSHVPGQIFSAPALHLFLEGNTMLKSLKFYGRR
jgi:hypothetical protein